MMFDEFEIIERLNGLMLGFNFYYPDLEYQNYELNISFTSFRYLKIW